jgi:hypothetical protein
MGEQDRLRLRLQCGRHYARAVHSAPAADIRSLIDAGHDNLDPLAI